MKIKKTVTILSIAVLAAGVPASTALAADASEAKEKKPAAKADHKERERTAKDALSQFDTDGDGVISEAEKAAAGDRYRRVTEAMARKTDGSEQHAERMAKRDDMKASKEGVNEAGPEAKREAIEAMKAEKEATKEAKKSGELTKEEAKDAKKAQKKWWQFWKSGN